MKYSTEIIIDKHIDKVIELFDNPDNLSKWMEGLQSFEPISGTPGQPGAKSKLKFKMGKREFEMVKTITVLNLPDESSGFYESKGVLHKVKTKFLRISHDKTKHITEHEFKFNGFMKLIGVFMPGAFKKQSAKYQTDFKKFVEKG